MKIVIDPHYQDHADFIGSIPRLLDNGEAEMVYDKRNQVAEPVTAEATPEPAAEATKTAVRRAKKARKENNTDEGK